jgi:hypothetical protein
MLRYLPAYWTKGGVALLSVDWVKKIIEAVVDKLNYSFS